jgi:hypothetical protein
MSSERSFFQKMEEFGFLGHIYEHLPTEFTAVFEIARVLEDETSELFRKLEPALRLATIDASPLQDIKERFQYDIPSGEEYEADYIRNRRDLPRIYSWQFLLPEEVFDERLAERTLWLPVAKAPVIVPVQEAGETFDFDSQKQKVFILFDTSNSMRAHHRIHLAKAILFHFLNKNKEEMGYISLRTFDDKVGEMHTAVDAESYTALVKQILRITQLGQGTVLQKAILTAIDDIASLQNLAGAEILIITDGAVVLDEELIRRRLDGNTKLHAIKIGKAQVFPSQRDIEDRILAGKGTRHKLVHDLLAQEREVQAMLRNTQSKDKHQQLSLSLRGIQSEIKKIKEELGEEITKVYGHELQRLASVFIEIEDLSETAVFFATEEQIDDIQMLIASLQEDAEQFFSPEMTKKAAILHDHIGFLLQYESNEALRKRLQELDERLRDLLTRALGEEASRQEQAAEGQADRSSSISLPMTDEDLRDLHFLLEFDGKLGRTQFKLLFQFIKKLLVKAAKRVIKRVPKFKLR